MYRTHNCNALRKTDIGRPVTLAGWVERLRKFGIQADEPRVILPVKEAGRMTPLAEWAAPPA